MKWKLQSVPRAVVQVFWIGTLTLIEADPATAAAVDHSVVLGRLNASPTIVDTVGSPLTEVLVGRLSEYFERCLEARPRVLSKIPVSGSEPLIVLGTAQMAHLYNVPPPPASGDEEAFSLATLRSPRTVVVASGATDKGVKRAIWRLILLYIAS